MHAKTGSGGVASHTLTLGMEVIFSGGRWRRHTPITAALHAYPPASLALMDSIPGVSYADQAVPFTSDDLHMAYRSIRKLTTVATTAYTGLLMEEVRFAAAVRMSLNVTMS
jgi:hypothetical protein